MTPRSSPATREDAPADGVHQPVRIDGGLLALAVGEGVAVERRHGARRHEDLVDADGHHVVAVDDDAGDLAGALGRVERHGRLPEEVAESDHGRPRSTSASSAASPVRSVRTRDSKPSGTINAVPDTPCC